MVWLPFIWLAFALVLVGCGSLVSIGLARLYSSLRAPMSAFQLFWFGYAFTILLLELCSLVLPIQWPVFCLWMGCGALGLLLGRRTLLRRLSVLSRRRALAGSLVLSGLLLALLIAAGAAQPVTWYDSLLYHLQVVQWARSYPAVFGIANLHYRLAYNNSIHLFGALTDVVWRGGAAHIAVGLLTTATALQLVACVLRPLHARGRLCAAYALVTLPFVLSRAASGEVSSLSSDLPLNLLGIVIVLELVRWHGRSGRSADASLALVLALSATATTTKLGGLGLFAVCAAKALWSLRTQGGGLRRGLALGVLPASMLALYFVRQSVLSGWLLFPAPVGNLHLPWSLPEAETLDQFRWIQSWARIPDRDPSEVLDRGLWKWFRPWFRRFSQSREFGLWAASSAFVVLRLAVPRGQRGPWLSAALAACIVSLVVWFRGAPDLRFGAGFFWMLFAVLAAPVLEGVLAERAGRWLSVAASLALVYTLGGFSVDLPSAKACWRLSPVKRRSVEERQLSDGLRVLVPELPEDRCGDEPLPCTPVPARQRLRRPGDLGSGFIYEGDEASHGR